MKLRILSFIAILAALIFVFAVSAYAEEAVPENYVDTNDGYIIYTDDQYKEVILGVYEGTLDNKKIIFGCDITVTLDLYMEKPCDITIDLNGHTYTNNYRPVKVGDFDLRHKDAIIRISNGNMVSNFCVFVFQKNSDEAYKDVDNMGQVYLENVNISCQEEIVYNYGGHGGVLSFKNCNLDVRGENYSVMGLGNCQTGKGTLYQIDGGSYDGLQIHCAKPGSYVKNCTVYNRNLNIDSWHGHSESGSDVSVEVRNVVIEIEVYLNDALVDPMLYDCTFPKVNLSNKSNAVIISYTSPTCTEPGTMTTYHHLQQRILHHRFLRAAILIMQHSGYHISAKRITRTFVTEEISVTAGPVKGAAVSCKNYRADAEIDRNVVILRLTHTEYTAYRVTAITLGKIKAV